MTQAAKKKTDDAPIANGLLTLNAATLDIADGRNLSQSSTRCHFSRQTTV